MRLLPCIITTLCILVVSTHALSQEPDLTRSIQNQKVKAERAQKQIQKLTRQERALHRNLADAADRIQLLERNITQKQRELRKVEKKHAQAQKQYKSLIAQRQKTEKDLSTLLEAMWPLYVQNKANKGLHTTDWDKADRQYAWTTSVYTAITAKQQELSHQEQAIASALTLHKALANDAKSKLQTINEHKRNLLQKKLTQRKQLATIRKKKTSAEGSLRSVLRIIQELHFQLEQGSITDKQFSLFKGTLPWPADGLVAERYNPKSRPPARGIGIALRKGTPVNAVASGNVVHSDTLRGFGHVVILLHGSSYYSLYAFMEDTQVKNGQKVESGQILGKAGYYPKVEGTGLYFELRFHQKAINPEAWLTALN